MHKLHLVALSLFAALTSTSALAVECIGPCSVPEPGSLALLGLGLAGIVATRLLKK